jgi:hypothetical protein
MEYFLFGLQKLGVASEYKKKKARYINDIAKAALRDVAQRLYQSVVYFQNITRKCNFIRGHNKSMTFLAPICATLIIAQ